jgi:Ca2+:H+ antiporter
MSSEVSIAPEKWNLACLRREWRLLPINVTCILFLMFSEKWFANLSNMAWFALLLAWLFSISLLASFGVVRHADNIAHVLGEPLGTLVLTIAVTGIEVMTIAAVMYQTQGQSTLARDSMFAVVMIVLNGMVGLSLLLGAMKYREQEYSLPGANSFLALVIPLAVLGLILPNYTLRTPGPSFSAVGATFLILVSLGLYAVFLAMQNLWHRDYFIQPTNGESVPEHASTSEGPLPLHIALLLIYLVLMFVLTKKLAVLITYGINVLHAPPALGGLLVATLILSPESLSAARAALANQLQRSVNLLLGSVLATISLTIPAVLIIGLINGQPIILGLHPADQIMLALTLVLSLLTFGSTRTNVLLGAVHLLLFLAYLMLIFEK